MSLLHLSKRSIAINALDLTYRHWLAWKDSSDPRSRVMALKAKVYGLIAHDKIMCGQY